MFVVGHFVGVGYFEAARPTVTFLPQGFYLGTSFGSSALGGRAVGGFVGRNKLV